MANDYGGGIRIQRTGAATWVVYKNGVNVSGTLTTRRSAESTAAGLISNAAATDRVGNLKTAVGEVQLVTLTGYAGTDSFALTDGENSTVPFVRGTNGTAAAIQTALRTLTGDASLTATGTTDEGPFTVTFVAETTRQPLLQQGVVSGCTAAITCVSTGGVGV